MALHCVAFLCRGRPGDLRVLLVDGSPRQDDELARSLPSLGVEYVHCGRELCLAETYNAGITRTSSPVVVLVANDVLIEAIQVRMLAQEIRDGVGCALPYLSFSDYGAQRARKLRVPRRCFPTRMTLNVNAFSRRALEQVGLIPEQMSGCYNDVVLSIRLREEGYAVVLRNVGAVTHLGQQTLRTGATSVDYRADARLFAEQYPRYWRRGVVLFHKVAQRPATRVLYRAVEALPAELAERLGLWRLAWAVEPYLCAEQGTVKEALKRIIGRARAPRPSGESALPSVRE
jgi:GT2 family glycosyltransferase